MTNAYMLLFGLAETYITQQLVPYNFFYKLGLYQIVLLLKNYILMGVIKFGIKHKADINDGIQPKEVYPGEFALNIFTSTFIENLTLLFVQYYYFTNFGYDVMWDLLWFVPISFMFEIIFDFFHYWVHRMIHSHPQLYKHIHKKHHKFAHPTPIITFYQEPLDLILTNTLPTLLTLCIIPKISYFQYILITLYKTFIEISGHCGKKLHPTSSFIQFMWLPKWLGIELYTEDHDKHHSKNNCNYSKRFSLWDKVLGTYI